MVEERDANPPTGGIVLEHLTGPSHGTVTWLNGSTLDVSLTASRFLHVSEARSGEPAEDTVARLHPADETYEVVAIEGKQVWVNGDPIDAQKLENRDIIEFGETGPLSRFRLYRDDQQVRKSVAEILRDGLEYHRSSRRPVANRAFRTISGVLGRLTHETTLLFRLGVIFAILVLGALAYQQNQLNILLQQRIESGVTQLESFAGALARAREESLTPNDLKALREEVGRRLSLNVERLAVLEKRSQASARVIANSKSSVVFLQGAYGFKERSSGRMLRHAVDDNGRRLISPTGQPLLSLEGDGPVAERQITGTGFAVGDGKVLVTNRHLALPWEYDANIKALVDQGLGPVMIKFVVYVPGISEAGAVELLRTSESADLAILRRTDVIEPIAGLKFADMPPAPGDEIIVMGYPTGLRAMLAHSGEEFIEELQKTKDIGFWSVAARLAAKNHIVPLASRGIVSQATPAAIVYDAETTHGGSGGPVLDINGAVVAVNTAILPEYGGSNMGVPVAKLRAFLEDAGLR
jgi:serine protease Do